MGDAHDHFLLRFWLTLTEGGAVHGPTLRSGSASIALVLVLRWLKRTARLAALPGASRSSSW